MSGSGGPAASPGTTTPSQPPPLRAPTRFSWAGIALLGGAAVIAFVVTVGIFLPALGELGRMGQDPASLPRQLTVCDRTWDRGLDVTRLTAAEVFARDDREPIVVTASGPGACPAGACGADAAANEGCAAVIYVQKREDEYVRYELVASP
jgi:hypothetical protein